MKKAFSVTLCALLIGSIALAGCTHDTPQVTQSSQASTPSAGTSTASASDPAQTPSEASSLVTEPGTLPIVTSPVTLRYMISQPATLKDFATNAYTVWMEEQTGVHIEFEATPSTAMQEKLSIVLASGDYPDAFIGMQLTPAQELQYGMNDKMLLGLNALIEQYGVVTKQRFQEAPEMRELATSMDGEIYSLPTYTTLQHVQVAQRMWINKTWLDALGRELPTTTEELYKTLKDFKTKDLNGNGKQDEIPLMGTAGNMWHGLVDGYLTEPFIYYDGNSGTGSGSLGAHMYSDNGTLKYIPVQPAYRDALRYINKLWSEGLIYSGSYTQTGDQSMQLIENPDAPLVGAVTVGNLHTIANIGEDRYRDFVVLPPLTGPTGLNYSYWDPYGGVRLGYFAISAASKYPEVAMRWADYCYTDDASLRHRQGEKDVDWRDANNVNFQMCYWQAEAAALQGAMHRFFDFVERALPRAKKAARDLYGCRGAVYPLQTDCWGRATPESFGYSVWIGGGAWLAQHFWKHYEYGCDKSFLATRAYPFMKEVAAFYEDYLVEDQNGVLQIVPSQSPENSFVGGDDHLVTLGVSAACDVQLAAELLKNTATAARILDVDPGKATLWEHMRSRLPGMGIGKHGQIMEWNQDFEEAEPKHRHFSQLYGLFPGDELALGGEVLRRAARLSIERRLSGGRADHPLQLAWLPFLYARLEDGEATWNALVDSICNLAPADNFRMDVFLAIPAVICEMLLADYGGRLKFLPALPGEWRGGSVRGLRARGGFTVDMKWRDGRLMYADITAVNDTVCVVYDDGYRVLRCDETPAAVDTTEYALRFAARSGEIFRIVPVGRV